LRIFLVDGSQVFRMGMRAVLGEAGDITVVGEADDARRAEAIVGAHAPDVVVTDLELSDGSLATLAGALRKSAPAAHLLVLSARVPEAAVKQSLLWGARGHVFKTQPPSEIIAAIRDVARGRQVTPPATASEGSPKVASAAALERLSAREREIFNLIIWGQTNKQVAIRLGISVKTVETHRSHINGKLQVHSAAELVRLASLCGALTENGPPPDTARPEVRSGGPRLVARG
jgi:DNA-binding NarL/FixJ family response regulator